MRSARRNPGLGRRQLRGSADARRQLHESCPSPRSPLRAGPALSFHAELRRRDPPPARRSCPAAPLRGFRSRHAHALPLGSSLQASRAGVLRGPVVVGRGPRRPVCMQGLRPRRWAPGGRMPGRLGVGGRGWRAICAPRASQVRAPPAAIHTMWSCPGAQGAARLLLLFLSSPAPASPRSAVMSGGRG